MNLDIKGKGFLVCGATSGFGLGITKTLINEGAKVFAVARNEDKLRELKDAYQNNIETFQHDLTDSKSIQNLFKQTEKKDLAGILVNAGGPPAMKFMETKMKDWDEAYHNILRWKIELTQTFLPRFIKQNYGRFVYIESSAVKQPLENLVLSTSMRLSVVGAIKTLSQELPDKGVTFNILAPGYHYTPAVERLINKKALDEKISKKQAKKLLEDRIPMKKTGDVDNFAGLATWLLSPFSEYITGQIFAVDGGVLRGTL
jgi:3-oxoacyl-[acyl-carrier protein] reductase